MRYIICLLLLLCFLSSWSQEITKVKLIDQDQKKLEAIKTTKSFFKSVNRVIKKGRDQVPITKARADIDRIMYLFDKGATMQESTCKKGVEVKGPHKKMKDYLTNQYYKAVNKKFEIKFEEPEVISSTENDFYVQVKFWQDYESKTYEDRTLKKVYIRFEPLGNDLYKVRIVRIIVLETICE